jgi:hypothetical protein
MMETTASKPPPADAWSRPTGGLCSSCSHSETCQYLWGRSQPALDCDEFDGLNYAEGGLGAFGGDAKQTTGLTISHPAGGAGLCIDCESGGACAFRPSGATVLECAEYR